MLMLYIAKAELSWHEWATKEGSMPLDDENDFHLAEYDVRQHLSEKVIDEAIPEYRGTLRRRRIVISCEGVDAVTVWCVQVQFHSGVSLAPSCQAQGEHTKQTALPYRCSADMGGTPGA